MPELPEVETTKTSLKPLLGAKLNTIHLHCTQLRWAVPQDLHALKNHYLVHIDRRAKYLILYFHPNKAYQHNNTSSHDQDALEKRLIIHLGMSGSLQQYPQHTQKRKHDHVIMQFIDTQNVPRQLHYHDPRRFGAILWYDEYADKLLSSLAVEPLTTEFNAKYLYALIHPQSTQIQSTHNKKREVSRPIKSVIMDQKFVVGVGNIYATESLFLSGIHPLIPANQLTLAQLQILVDNIKTILKNAIQQGGSTLKDFTVSSGQTGYFQQTLHIYGKHNQSCPKCSNLIDKVTITGRASTFCSTCQPYPTTDSL
ncbi:bifunctional DNA-formamidopyrimidine glycosylase/DNA-(apurinic or apyrimidinic site) lyase [Psychrobacter sp. I-STPA6b]|uniref:bifunctional DNA-formamidopyrimidine glycosylase/DNA-(apurinic or apyrimidinic site) lyase n=1 Tax=Psychrobacter sp. I-STPA6b TaxID=2585718 RepID=UPI001D0CA311|nr:bifunctional DNA-formamidopyrimidine glycosylase/DNA-(apurinic or apyrimidinic site) lyase [Psychrobacter sp. I-STPA6b]